MPSASGLNKALVLINGTSPAAISYNPEGAVRRNTVLGMHTMFATGLFRAAECPARAAGEHGPIAATL